VVCVWASALGSPESVWPAAGTYEAQSPTLGQRIEYDDGVIVQECERMAAEAQGTKWSAGRSIWLQAPFCFNPQRLYSAEAFGWLEDYRLSLATNTPLALTVDQLPADMADAVLVIQREEAAVQAYRQEQANG
jgi:hypothetical protein